MNWLTIENFGDFRFMATIAMGIAIVFPLVLTGFLRWWKKAPLVQKSDFLKLIENSWFYVIFALLLLNFDTSGGGFIGNSAKSGIIMGLGFAIIAASLYLTYRRIINALIDDEADAALRGPE